jgi:hypothetical protein
MERKQIIAGGIILGIIALCYVIIFISVLFSKPMQDVEPNVTKQNIEIKTTPNTEAIPEKEEVVIKEEPVAEQPVVKPTLNYRLTSYYKDDGTGVGNCTGSGKCIKDFTINEKGWYTYQGKLVLGGATKACLNTTGDQACMRFEEVSGRHYFNYFEEITITIDNISYDAIILDSCGACMYVNENRLDLFVSSLGSRIDRGYKGNNLTIVQIRE